MSINQALQDATEQIKRLKAELADQRRWVADLQSGMWINCVYCGHRYGPRESTAPAIHGASETMADALRKHIETCPKHPMSALRDDRDNAARNERLRWADRATALAVEGAGSGWAALGQLAAELRAEGGNHG